MYFPETPVQRGSGTFGQYPFAWVGNDLPDGDALPFSAAPLNSVYLYTNETTGGTRVFKKVLLNDRNDDWQPVAPSVITKRVTRAMMTDGGAAIGTYTLADEVPIGAFVQQTILSDLTGFTGDTSATIQVGDGTDVDRYSTGTPSVFTTAAAIDLGVPSGTKIHVAAKAPVITVTSAADFTAVAAGAFTLRLFFLGGYQ